MYNPSEDLELVNELRDISADYAEILFSVNTKKILADVITELQLTPAASDEFLKTVYGLFTGAVVMENFDSSIKNALQCTNARAGEVLDIVTEKILDPVVQALQEKKIVQALDETVESLQGENEEDIIASENLSSTTSNSKVNDDVTIETNDGTSSKKSIRTPASVSYTKAQPSHERKGKEGIIGDPYREQEL